MRRYRTVILVFVFGVVPMASALVLAVTVILPSLNETDAAVEQAEVVEEAPPPEPVMMRVALTAAGPLVPGTLLTAGDLAVTDVRDSDVSLPEEYYVYVAEVEDLGAAEPRKRVDRLRGHAVRRAMAAGEPVLWDAVVGPDDAQFLATVLAPDRVAVSIPVSLANRQAKLVSPGNRVDVLLAVEQEGELVVGTIVEDVRVIAVNSRVIAETDVSLGEQDRADGSGGGSPRDVLPDTRPEVTTVTLEVRPVEGEHLALGAYEGQLSLAIRPLDTALRRRAQPLQNLRSVLRLPAPAPEPVADPVRSPPLPVSVRVVRGISEETVVFSNDGDDAGLTGQSAGDAMDRPRSVTGAAPSLPETRTR